MLVHCCFFLCGFSGEKRKKMELRKVEKTASGTQSKVRRENPFFYLNTGIRGEGILMRRKNTKFPQK